MSIGHFPAKARVFILVAVAVAVWWGLDRLGPRAGWLRVEAPRRAVVGEPLTLRVQLPPPVSPGFLCADLHWATTRDTTQGYLAGGGCQTVGGQGGSFDFAVPVPPRNGLRFVCGVIYLSTTGDWHDHTRAAITELIPVVAGDANRPATLSPLAAQTLDESALSHPRPPVFPRLVVALLFLLAAVKSWNHLPGSVGRASSRAGVASVLCADSVKPQIRRYRLGSSGDSPHQIGKRGWRILAVALALACVWELFNLEILLGDKARALARAGDFYYPRAVFQKVMVSAVVAAATVFLVWLWRVRRSGLCWLAFVGIYLGIAAVNLLSLHAIDQVADLAWHGVTLAQALKLGCAALTLHGICRRAPGNFIK